MSRRSVAERKDPPNERLLLDRGYAVFVPTTRRDTYHVCAACFEESVEPLFTTTAAERAEGSDEAAVDDAVAPE